MSLSLQKKHLIDRKKIAKELESLPCPECGQVTMKKIKRDCTLLDGTFIPELEYFYCSSCHSKFYDDVAMAKIEDKRSMINSDQPA